MATLAERIVETLQVNPPGLDDDQLAARLGVIRQAINQACRKLADAGHLTRGVGPDGKIINTLDRDWQPALRPVAIARSDGLLTEDEVKSALKAHLEGEGYMVKVAWGRERGIDIDAKRDSPPDRLVLEAKGEVKLQPQQVNYFLGALGELVQRMDDPDARYGLALPDNAQYRGLIRRLPRLAWERLGLVVLLVRREGESYVVESAPGPS